MKVLVVLLTCLSCVIAFPVTSVLSPSASELAPVAADSTGAEEEKPEEKPEVKPEVTLKELASERSTTFLPPPEIQTSAEGQGTRVIHVPPRSGGLRYASFEPFIEFEKNFSLDASDHGDKIPLQKQISSFP